jgi:hypothetical protein
LLINARLMVREEGGGGGRRIRRGGGSGRENILLDVYPLELQFF